MSTPELILEYLKVVLSSPPVVGAVAVVFITLFRTPIAELINRILHLRFPGMDLVASQQEKATKEIAPAGQAPQGLPAEVPANIKLTPEQAQQIGQLIQSERANAALWEYRYLNYFLVRSTQVVVEWLGTLPQPIGVRLLDTHLQQWIPNAKEREAILAALQNHRLVTVDNDLVQITPKGREYLQWRGPLPPIPPSA